MTIRRVTRTLVVEYVTDRNDNDLPEINPRDIGNGRVLSEVVTVVDAAVTAKVAAVEALVSQGADAKTAGEMFDRQRDEAFRAKAFAATDAAAKAARAKGEDPEAAARAVWDALQADYDAEKLKESK